ncbi:MAG: marine proteobacterial sortase target protein [Cellvibrionaceae bacterium]|nr:marine proteobacterial sortase target protein [Cellvibrionaceae bacterium]
MCFQPPRIPKHRLLNDRDYSNPLFRTRRGNTSLLRGILLLTALFATFVFVAESTRADALAADSAPSNRERPQDSQSGQLFLKTADKRTTRALHLNSEVSFNVSGMVLHTRFSQTFRNSSEDQWVDGIYVFPLPEKAAVSRMEMHIGERVIVGEIKEKAAAKKQYEKAKAAGKRVALIEQERPNLFTQNLANIGPNEEVTIILEYHDTIQYDAGRFSFRFPMTMTPRFMPGNFLPSSLSTPKHPSDDEGSKASLVLQSEQLTATQLVLDNSRPWGWSAPTSLVPDAHRISPPQLPLSSAAVVEQQTHQLKLSVNLDAGLPLQTVSSPYHDIVIEKQRQQHFITTRNAQIPMDRDFELQWQPVAQKIPSAAAFTETLNSVDDKPSAATNENYTLLMLLPPQQAPHSLARDVIYIIDTSASMGGNSIRQAKQSLSLALQRLKSGDRFNVIEFNSTHRSLFTQSQALSDHSRQQALQFVHQLNAGGGTHMVPALDSALSSPIPETHLRQVVFITDGSVGNEAQLFQLIHNKLDGARLFTVGIGSAPNSFFMRKAAEFGRGTFTHIGSEQEVASKMSRLFQKLESPVLRNLQIDWPDAANADVWPRQLPDLYQGEPLLIKAKLDNLDQTHRVQVSGDLAGQSWQQSLQLGPNTDSTSNHTGISKLWAREKISSLLDEKTRGTPEADIKPQVLNLALRHQLMSPYTSFIAEDKTPARPNNVDSQSQLVPNLTPKGQKTLVYPNTATSAPLNIALGFMALMMFWLQRGFSARRATNRESLSA